MPRSPLQVDSRDQWGNTPLHLACASAAREVALLLVEQGADIHAPDEVAQKSPLDCEALEQDTELRQLLEVPRVRAYVYVWAGVCLCLFC